jgi:hypothetical protein
MYHGSSHVDAVEVGDDWLGVDDVRKGYNELKVSQL